MCCARNLSLALLGCCLWACGGADADDDDEFGEVPSASSAISHGYLKFCGGEQVKITGGELKQTGWVVPSGLSGTVKTEAGDVEIEANIKASPLNTSEVSVTSGTSRFDGKTVNLEPSKLAVSGEGDTQSLEGTVNACDCADGISFFVQLKG